MNGYVTSGRDEGACGLCSECKAGESCTASFRLLPVDGGEELAARVVAALGFINRMRGVDANVDAVLAQVQRLLTEPATAASAEAHSHG